MAPLAAERELSPQVRSKLRVNTKRQKFLEEQRAAEVIQARIRHCAKCDRESGTFGFKEGDLSDNLALALLGSVVNEHSDEANVKRKAKQHAARSKMRELFKKVDTDGSRSLDFSEIKELVKAMGDRMSAMQLRTAFERMDPERSGEVKFPSFAKWWKYKQQEYRRD